MFWFHEFHFLSVDLSNNGAILKCICFHNPRIKAVLHWLDGGLIGKGHLFGKSVFIKREIQIWESGNEFIKSNIWITEGGIIEVHCIVLRVTYKQNLFTSLQINKTGEIFENKI